MNGRHNGGNSSPVDKLLEGLEGLKKWLQQFTRGFAIWLIPVILLALWLGSGIYVVGPGERGVVLLFGKVVNETGPGLRYRFPWPIESHAVVDIAQVRRAEVGFRTVGATPSRTISRRETRASTRTVPQEALMLTGDENMVEVQLFVQYLIQDPVQFLFRARNPEEILHTSTEVALRSAVGQNTIDYTMTEGRFEVQEQAKLNLQSLLDAYETGLLVTEARLLVVDPPEEVRDAFHDVVRALEDRDRLVKESEGYQEDIVPKARGEAAQMVQQAEAYKAQRVIRAQGDGEKFLKILAEYQKAKEITRDRLYLESVERIMPSMEKFILNTGESGGVLPILPLKDLVSSPTSGEAGGRPQGNSSTASADGR